MTANIYKIDRLNTHNGPGFRTVIYFKGCPLHCTWCHNPEGISPKKEVWFNASKCIGCGTCVEECPESALTLSEHGIAIDRKACSGCQHCTEVCPSKAMEKIGEDYSVNELMKIIRQDAFLFESSGGGITVTGGEPGMYPDFVAELFRQCCEEGIHTAFDTCGAIAQTVFSKILPYTNLVFLDLKILNDSKSIRQTGLPLARLERSILTLNKLSKELKSVEVEVRTPLVPKQTDNEENLMQIGNYITQKLPAVKNWEMCMFNDLCEDKYQRMSMPWHFKGLKHGASDYERFSKLQKRFPNIRVHISGFIDKTDHQ